MTQPISDQRLDHDRLMERLALKDTFGLEVLNWPVFRLIILSTLPRAPGDISDAIARARLSSYDKTPALDPTLNQRSSAGVLGDKYM